jgi:hypothetical protein
MKNAILALFTIVLSLVGLNAMAAQHDPGSLSAEHALPDEQGPANGDWG